MCSCIVILCLLYLACGSLEIEIRPRQGADPMLEERQPVRVHEPALAGFRSVQKDPTALGHGPFQDPVADCPRVSPQFFGDFGCCQVSVVVLIFGSLVVIFGHLGLLFATRGTYAPPERIQKEEAIFFGCTATTRPRAAFLTFANLANFGSI
mgnify:CR=1 FL=1